MIYRIVTFLLVSFFSLQLSFAQRLLIEAESFDDLGKWVDDSQLIEQMGAPYLLAHGVGTSVANANTKFKLDEAREYHYLGSF